MRNFSRAWTLELKDRKIRVNTVSPGPIETPALETTTGLTPEQRFQNHKNGHKAAHIVTRCGERLVPRLYEHLNPMPYAKAVEMEVALADSLRKRGFVVYGGH